MTFKIFDDPQQGAGFVLCIITIPLCTLATVLRFVATIRAHRSFGFEDAFAFIALLFHLLFTTIFIYRKYIVNCNKSSNRHHMNVWVPIANTGWLSSPDKIPGPELSRDWRGFSSRANPYLACMCQNLGDSLRHVVADSSRWGGLCPPNTVVTSCLLS